MRYSIIGLLGCALLTGCNLDDVREVIEGPYHQISPANGGVHITFKRHASNCMGLMYQACRNEHSEATCGTRTLSDIKGVISAGLKGAARDAWNSKISVHGFSFDLKTSFAADEGGDFVQAIKDAKAGNRECLRITWKPTGENWTSVNDEGISECDYGSLVKNVDGSVITCPEFWR
jgi:hypothetical protein